MHWRLLPLALCAACASPREATTHIEDAEERVLARVPEAEIVERALALADLNALGIDPPTAAELADPGADGYWHAAAYTFAPPVRDARAKALAALAREGAAGAPGPVGLRTVDHEFGGADVLFESVATFDLIGLLGVGPSAAAQRLARAESLSALTSLELALWEARFAVDQDRISLAAVRERHRRTLALLDEAREDLPRVDILARTGRLGDAIAASARAQVDAVGAAADQRRSALSAGRARLAIASGLPYERVDPEHTTGTLERELAGDLPLSDAHPALRARRVELAVAEARLRAVATRAWPGLQAGPHLGFPDGDFGEVRVGGLLALSLPFPSTYAGPLEAAAVERDRVVERYEETLLELSVAFASALERHAAAQDRLAAAREVDAASTAAWAATRAAFRASRADAMAWREALQRRLGALNLVVDAAEEVARTALDVERAAGPQGGAR